MQGLFQKNRKLFSFSSRKHPFFSLGADVAKVFFEAKGESADGGGVLCADIAQDKIIAFNSGFVLFSGGIAEHKAVMRHVSLQPAVGICCRKRCGVSPHGDAQAALQVACYHTYRTAFCNN